VHPPIDQLGVPYTPGRARGQPHSAGTLRQSSPPRLAKSTRARDAVAAQQAVPPLIHRRTTGQLPCKDMVVKTSSKNAAVPLMISGRVFLPTHAFRGFTIVVERERSCMGVTHEAWLYGCSTMA